MVSRRRFPGLTPIALLLVSFVNVFLVTYVKNVIQELRKERQGYLEVHSRSFNQENAVIERLDHLETYIRNISISMNKPSNEDKKLLQMSKKEMHQKENKLETEKKAVPRILFPDSYLFKRWGTDLTEDQQTKAQELFTKYGYNVYLSDQLPLDRPIRDTRYASCKKKSYPKDLPTLSVILIFMNEAVSIILRAITSIINRTPSHLLKEIILVDDHSSNDGFDWAMWCLYEALPEEWYKLKDDTAPVRSPSIMGILAAHREFLGEIGVLDGGMHIYGGENVELGLRAWQCGGKVEVLPCSRIAHLERAHKPYLLDLSIAMRRNALRVAEVWMDDYKNMVYFAWNLPIENHGIDYGDVTSRKELRKKLNCKSFDWYIKNVYPNLVPMNTIVGYGTIKNTLKEDICIDQGPVPGNTPIMYGCHGYSPQHVFYHSTGEIYVGGLKARRNAVDRCLSDPGTGDLPFLDQCDEAINKGLNMYWDFEQGSSIINRKTKRCLEILRDETASYYTLVMKACTGQKWTIQHTVKDWGRKDALR
ncbi:probable polypeptide N-acetylgalactosaminyltransferase 8 isoform X3 [Alligator mississippiensis]|uniref:probable polypeptide N-acetylgalactosaminyltransferase 8 isoform X3 n=1 Tax=Alligator mississippiensis TaxID=8496 RepID=UPI0009072BA5|nr:probable polypeptide N-acetylgalactosaminyltransferase 8 isoform X3 [Alligator mississippiensis]